MWDHALQTLLESITVNKYHTKYNGNNKLKRGQDSAAELGIAEKNPYGPKKKMHIELIIKK